jgi:D-xylose transport system substrate-binding protein
MQHWKVIGLVAFAAFTTLAVGQAQKAKYTIGVSWSNFQEERWRTDEAAMGQVFALSGAEMVSTDAQASSEKQLADIDSLIAKRVNAIIVLAMDKDAILPAIQKAKAAKIPVIAYDRLFEDTSAFYLTFDNVEVGRMEAREVLKAKPKGNYVLMKGDPGDPNVEFLRTGQLEVLNASIKRGDVRIVGEAFSEAWNPDEAQSNMVDILKKNNNKVDAVIASNDGLAGGAFAALNAVGLGGGKVALAGQDGDLAALNRVARGTQTVSVWKDARALGKKAAEISLQLARGVTIEKIPGRLIFSKGPKKARMNSYFVKPVPITRANLNVVVDARWISKTVLCEGVDVKAVAICK